MKLRTIAFIIFMILVFFTGIPLVLIGISNYLELPVINNVFLKIIGVLLITAEILIFLNCSSIFIKYGKGTPLLTEKTSEFVKKGLYKHVRNPIFIGHFFYFSGLYLVFGHAALLIYLFLIMVFVNLIVVCVEEPNLKKKYGKKYETYLNDIPRWIPKLKV